MSIIPQLSSNASEKLVEELQNGLEKLDSQLAKLFVETLLDNPSGAMPYHGNLHTSLFLKSLILLSTDDRVILTHNELLALVTAAIHHDLDYRTTHGDDLENIEAAVTYWRKNSEKWIPLDAALVERLIRSTYLSVDLNENDPEYKLKGLMRDADLLGWIYSDYREILREGLEAEKGFKPYTSNFLEHFNFYNDFSRELIQDAGLA